MVCERWYVTKMVCDRWFVKDGVSESLTKMVCDRREAGGRREAVSSALNFPFLKEVSQNCFVFDVVKCKNK